VVGAWLGLLSRWPSSAGYNSYLISPKVPYLRSEPSFRMKADKSHGNQTVKGAV
jgi:hypothetical protein